MDDLHEIILYLNECFSQQQIIIVGHSWSCVLGSRFALEYPELVSTFVGAGQTVDVVGGILKMAEYVRSLAVAQNNTADAAAIDKLIQRTKNSRIIPNAEALELALQ